MPEWTICPQCSLKHGRRQDNLCPRCKQPVAGGGVAHHETAALMRDVYDGRAQPAANNVADDEDPPVSPWGTLAFGLLVLFGESQ